MASDGTSLSPARILIVDDSADHRGVLGDLVETMGHVAVPVADGRAALARLTDETTTVDVALVAVDMAILDGIGLLRSLKAVPSWAALPVIMIGDAASVPALSAALQAGAEDYLVKPFDPTLLMARIRAAVERASLRARAERWQHDAAAHQRHLEAQVQAQVAQVTASQLATIFALSKLAESRDPETGEHLERMREYCRILAMALADHDRYGRQIDAVFIDNVFAASPLHDIGKVGIPDRILQKPGRLTPDEFTVMKLHAQIGAETLQAVDRQHPGNAFIQMGLQIAWGHHEKWNGSGYPQGLMGEWIPLAARIVAIGDVYDALTSKRCYKEAFSHERSRDIIVAESGAHFDPEIVSAFLAREAQFLDVRRRFEDSEKTAPLS